MVISIDTAHYISEFKIFFEFSDGSHRTVDFESFLKKAKNPMSKKYLDIEKFKAFKLEYGDIQWNDYELCFPIWDLYRGTI